MNGPASQVDAVRLELWAAHAEATADYELKTGRKLDHTLWSRAAQALEFLNTRDAKLQAALKEIGAPIPDDKTNDPALLAQRVMMARIAVGDEQLTNGDSNDRSDRR